MALHVVILAAGKGTRMKSPLPKVLQPVADKPMVQHVIDVAKQLHAEKIDVVCGYGKDILCDALKNEPISFVLQEEQLGTGHAVQQAIPNMKDDDVVLVLYGDVPLIRLDTLQHLLSARKEQQLALLTVNLPEPNGYGRILRDDSWHVCGIVEQKDATEEQKQICEVNSGILAAPGAKMKLWLSMLKNENAQREFYLTDIVAMAYHDGSGIVTVHPASFDETEGANDRFQLARLERAYQQRKVAALMSQGALVRDPSRLDIRGDVQIGTDVRIDVNVVLEGRVVIGDNVSIGPNCVIRDSNIHSYAVINANSVLVDATVNQHVHVKPLSNR